MDIALLNIKIIFQKNEVVTNRIGNHKNEWKEFYSCFATVSGEGGIEKNVAGLITQDLAKLESSFNGSKEDGEEFAIDDLEIFESVACITAYHADSTIPNDIND